VHSLNITEAISENLIAKVVFNNVIYFLVPKIMTTSESSMQDLQSKIKKSIKQNANQTDNEPNVFLKNPNELRPNESPMVMNGRPTIKKPKLNSESIEVSVVDPETNEKTKEIVNFKTIPVVERENVTMAFLEMFELIGCIDKENKSVDLEKLDNIGMQELRVIRNYLRPIAGIVTDKPEKFYDNVPFSCMMDIFVAVMSNETGIIANIEDFLGTTETTTKE